MKELSNKELVELAASKIKTVKTGDEISGDVGCALISGKGNIYTGVCIDTSSSMGFCAEHNAIGSMATEQEYKIKKIVAVWKDKKGHIYIIPPCGRCREFMRQTNEENLNTEVILGKRKVAKVKELLPYYDSWKKFS